MARISKYQFDQQVTRDDFVIGSDAITKRTKNYKLGDLSSFFGSQQSVLGDKFSYTYNQPSDYHELAKAEISFNNKSQVNTSFSGINTVYLNKFNDIDVDVTDFFNSLAESGVLRLHNGKKTTDYGMYRAHSVEVYQNSVLKISVDLLLSNGSIADGDPVTISSSYAADKNHRTALLEGDIWQVQHNLGKFPSVTVVDTANNVIYGNVAYNDTNNVTITFASSVTGYAYFN